VSTGTYIANRVSDKIAQLSPHIYCCRSGSAADTQWLTDLVKHFLAQLAYVYKWYIFHGASHLKIVVWKKWAFLFDVSHTFGFDLNITFLSLSVFLSGSYSIQTGRPVRVKSAAHLMQQFCYEHKDKISAGVIVAGWDPVDGGSVYSIPMGGSCVKVPFALGGSGSLFIYGLVDAEISKENGAVLTDVVRARALVKQAVAHAMARDGSSGGIIRTVVVTPEGNDRDYTPGNALPFGPTGF
jgi:20S proteasome subunit beta 1